MNPNIQRAIDSASANVVIDSGGTFVSELKFLGQVGETINAIKKVRAATNLGLKDSKDLVERFFDLTENSSYRSSTATLQEIFETARADIDARQLLFLKDENQRLYQRVKLAEDERDEIRRLYNKLLAEVHHAKEKRAEDQNFELGVASRESNGECEGIPCTDPYCTECECDCPNCTECECD